MNKLLLWGINYLIIIHHGTLSMDLLTAVKRGNIEAVQTYLKNGADVNQQFADGWTLLHWAANYRQAGVIRLLILFSADTDRKNQGNYTPLYWAHFYRDQEIADLLQHFPHCIKNRNAVRLTMCSARHARLGAQSSLRQLDSATIMHIFSFMQPEDHAISPKQSLMQRIVEAIMYWASKRGPHRRTWAISTIVSSCWYLFGEKLIS